MPVTTAHLLIIMKELFDILGNMLIRSSFLESCRYHEVAWQPAPTPTGYSS